MKLLSDEQAKEVTAQVMSDQTPLQPIITIVDAWLLIGALQLATRHPEMSRFMRRALKRISGSFEKAITDLHPEARELLDMGWDPKYDVGSGK